MSNREIGWLGHALRPGLGDRTSTSIVDFLPASPKPGEWAHVQADQPVGVAQLNEATEAGWDMMGIIPLFDVGKVIYIVYLQYKGAIHANNEYKS